MSAAAKLKALEEHAYRNIDDPQYGAMWCSEVRKALPQIVAVVEAAERVPELRYSNDQPSLSAAWSAKDLRAALSALDEALA